MGQPLSAEEITALEARTEGWIVGLHLAVLSLQGRDDLTGFIAAFTGSNRYVLDYLVEEVLQRQPENVQHFLLQTCILDRLSGPLCDAVRQRDDSQMLLEHLERVNLFLVLLDDERQWFRYHHLFAEVLRSRLQQAEPMLVPELHHRASVWYEEHEQAVEAVQHALLAPDVERAARLIEQFAWLVWYRGQIHTLSSPGDAALPWRLSVSHPLTLQPLKKVTLQLLLWGTVFASSFGYTPPRHHHGQEVVPGRRSDACLRNSRQRTSRSALVGLV